jgi:ferrous iron transport protein A
MGKCRSKAFTLQVDAESNGVLLLADLKSGESGLVIAIADPSLKLALLRIGLIEGDRFAVAELAPFGGPLALRVRGGKVAMRRADAQKVQVRRIG